MCFYLLIPLAIVLTAFSCRSLLKLVCPNFSLSTFITWSSTSESFAMVSILFEGDEALENEHPVFDLPTKEMYTGSPFFEQSRLLRICSLLFTKKEEMKSSSFMYWQFWKKCVLTFNLPSFFQMNNVIVYALCIQKSGWKFCNKKRKKRLWRHWFVLVFHRHLAVILRTVSNAQNLNLQYLKLFFTLRDFQSNTSWRGRQEVQ